ncbi:hypothetical protein LAV79_26005 [Peribacillus butanolivorans]|uniref:hypothetical protein n=1 Tax=Peribacillus butanolivorans TaxID=421767 RepID=UPI0030C8D858
MNKYIKPFLVFEWITVLGASTAAYILWGFPLYICIGIVLLGVILTLEMVRVWQNPDQYIVKQGNYEPFIKYMEDEGENYIGEFEDGFLFENEKGNVTSHIGIKSFTKYYDFIDAHQTRSLLFCFLFLYKNCGI